MPGEQMPSTHNSEEYNIEPPRDIQATGAKMLRAATIPQAMIKNFGMYSHEEIEAMRRQEAEESQPTPEEAQAREKLIREKRRNANEQTAEAEGLDINQVKLDTSELYDDAELRDAQIDKSLADLLALLSLGGPKNDALIEGLKGTINELRSSDAFNNITYDRKKKRLEVIAPDLKASQIHSDHPAENQPGTFTPAGQFPPSEPVV